MDHGEVSLKKDTVGKRMLFDPNCALIGWSDLDVVLREKGANSLIVVPFAER